MNVVASLAVLVQTVAAGLLAGVIGTVRELAGRNPDSGQPLLHRDKAA